MTPFDEHPTPEFHPLVIVGAGLAGLILARVLQLHGRNVVVFEQEPARESRGQGGVLDLHVDSGQWALAQAGLKADFRALVIAGGEDTRILDKDAQVLWDEVVPPANSARPKVDRTALREMLINALAPRTVRWDHALVALAHVAGTQTQQLTFASGAVVTAGVVLGADGAQSTVRPSVTDVLPAYAGLSFIELTIPEVDLQHPAIASRVGRGSLFALGDDKGILAHRNGDGRIGVYIVFRFPEGSFLDRGITFGNPTDTRAAIAAQFEDWAPSLVDLVRACDNTFVQHAIYAMPIGVTWPSRGRVTVLGDAAHPMSPFAGEGANLAMQDGAELALQLIAANDPAAAIATFEAGMFSRATKAALAWAEGLSTCIAPDGAVRMAAMMRGVAQPGTNAPVRHRSR